MYVLMDGTNISNITGARLAEAVNYAGAPSGAPDGWHTPEARRERKARDIWPG